MNAAETLKQASAAADQRAYEPSMEEILASIRRIIADDQSLPNRAFVRDGEATLRAALDAPETSSETEIVSFEEQEPFAPEPIAPVAGNRESLATPDEAPLEAVQHAPLPRVASTGSLGRIAAPQFAMPDSPAPPSDAGRADGEKASSPGAERLSIVAPSLPTVHVEPRHDLIADSDERADRETIVDARAASHAAPELRHASSLQRPETASQDPETDAMSRLFSTATDQTVTAAFNTLAASRLVENDDVLKDMVRDMIRPLLKSWLDDNLPNMVERLVRAEIERVGRGGR